ncbi:MAG: amidohydrolase family protein [Eubacteriales bacterium]|nr:amidohydrolase family protein [Eubacteriales bacterium]
MNSLNTIPINEIPAIDIHSHTGSVHAFSATDCIENGTTEYLLRTMKLANIKISANTSRYAIMPRGSGYSVEGNRQMLKVTEEEGVFMWVTVDPHEPDTFNQAADYLKHPKVIGIKIHPEEHEYELEKEGDKLFSFAAKQNVPILGHAGAKSCMPETYGFFADRFPEIPVIAAHLGSGFDGDPGHHIRAIRESRGGNLYTDTSSMMSLVSNLLEYAIGIMGADHILFGTDSGNYFSPCQRARIDGAFISDCDKKKILFENALKLFPKLESVYLS